MSNTPRTDRLSKNFLINGAFDFWQRTVGPVNSSTSSSYIGPDRWKIHHTGTFTGTPNVRRSTTIPDSSFPFSLRHDFRRNASTATLTYEQRIEADTIAEMQLDGFGSVSVKVNPPVAGTVQIKVFSPTVKDNHASQTLMAQSSLIAVTASSWQEIKLENFSVTSGAANGLAIIVQYVADTGTDGADVSLFMTRVSLSATKKAIEFTRAGKRIDEEFDLCLRFYWRDTDNSFLGSGFFQTATEVRITMIWPRMMRSAPTAVIGSTGGLSIGRAGTSESAGAGPEVFSSLTKYSAKLTVTSAASGTQGFGTTVQNASTFVEASAEL